MGHQCNRPFSLGSHVESQENKKLCFCTASLALNSGVGEANRAKTKLFILILLRLNMATEWERSIPPPPKCNQSSWLRNHARWVNWLGLYSSNQGDRFYVHFPGKALEQVIPPLSKYKHSSYSLLVSILSENTREKRKGNELEFFLLFWKQLVG